MLFNGANCCTRITLMPVGWLKCSGATNATQMKLPVCFSGKFFTAQSLQNPIDTAQL